ncbi:MAG: hypothetical protein D6798_20130 [Deltaproteobacteria bacterium]|nr:MAG: hypothetical protein D6798_20130 [Deltaproteobacteria bacterium]
MTRRPLSLVLVALALLRAPAARAGVPDRVAASIDATSGAPWDLAPGPDALALVFVDTEAGLLGTLDLRSWEVETVSACSGAMGVAFWDDGSEVHVYTGCGDGSVATTTLVDGHLGSVETAFEVGDGAVLGVVGDGSLLYVLTDPDDGSYPTLHSVDPDGGTVDGVGGFPVTTSSSGFEDIALSGGTAFVLHGGDNLSKVTLSSGSLASESGSLSSLEGRDLVISSTGGSILAGGGSTVARFNTGDNGWDLQITSGDGLSEVDALGLLEQDGMLAVADEGLHSTLWFTWDSSTGVTGNIVQDELPWPTTDTAVTEMAVVLDDYLVAGTEDGSLWVATDRPWVDITATDPTVAGAGDTVEVRFTSDTDGTFELRLGTDSDDGGTLLSEGSVTAGETVEAQVGVDSDWVEGDNQLRVVVKDGTGLAGHDATVVSVDNPPGAVSLSESSVGIADGYLTLSLTAPDDADIATVTVYLSTVEFSAADWPEGGPEYEGPDDIAAPIEVSVSPAESIEVELSPLTNGTLYYIAARATDSGGLEGPMSDVVTGTPEETLSAAELAGEAGGFCGMSGAASGLLAGLGGLLAVGRRRRRGATSAVGVLSGLALLSLAPSARAAQSDAAAAADATTRGAAAADSGLADPAAGDAHALDGTAGDSAGGDSAGDDSAGDDSAGDDSAGDDSAGDDTVDADWLPTVEELVPDEGKVVPRAGVELRFGPMWFAEDNAIAQVLGDGGHNILWLEGGPTFWRVFQVSAGAGFYRKKGTLLTESGVASTQSDLLYAVPVTANLGLRLDLLDEQPFVPYASVGADYWLWRESWETDNSGGHAGIGGGKAGVHFAAGGQVLLDIFEPSRADTTQARLGIVDSYLTVEWRRQVVGVFSDGLDLSNDQLSVGVRVHTR